MVVQICGVVPCLSYELLATPQGACSARKRPAKYGRGENRWATHSFKPRWRTWSTFSIFPSGKTGTRRREHRVYWFPSSVYWFPICDGRNCELLNSMMTQICKRNRPHRVVKERMSSYELNPPKQKGVNLEGLGGWIYMYINHVCLYIYEPNLNEFVTHISYEFVAHISWLVWVWHIYICMLIYIYKYGVATVSRIDKITGLFCRILSLLWGSFEN